MTTRTMTLVAVLIALVRLGGTLVATRECRPNLMAGYQQAIVELGVIHDADGGGR